MSNIIMHRFFLDKFEQNNGEIKIFDEEQIHQIKDVASTHI